MAGIAAASVNDYLSARQTAVAVRSAHDELSRRVDVKFCIFVAQFRGNNGVNDFFGHVAGYRLLRNGRVVLRRNDNRVYANRFAVVVFNRDLRLSVGTKIRQCAVLPPRQVFFASSCA